jgi:hypothetical protein
LEKLATSDKATIVVERLTDGKMRVTSGSWDGEKVILRDQVLEVRPSSTPGCRGPRGAQAGRVGWCTWPATCRRLSDNADFERRIAQNELLPRASQVSTRKQVEYAERRPTTRKT